jgi:hypothetical protein
MEKLPSERRAEVKKMSDVRLVAKLQQAGFTPEQLELMDRSALMEAWAELILANKDKAPPAAAAASKTGYIDPDVEKQRLLLDIERFKWEQEEAKRRFDEERARYEDERELRRQEMKRLIEKDQKEAERQNSTASKIKLFGDAFRNAAFKMSNDPIDLIPFFNNVERLFAELGISPELRVPLMRPYLNDKAKSLLMRLDATLASSYDKVKQFLLHEFALTPASYLERFNTVSRQNDETYKLFCSRLKGLLDYYVDSRSVNDFQSLISLLVSDRIKTTLSEDCLKYVLSVEATSDKGWLPHDKLSEVIDVYFANHWCDKPRTGAIGKYVASASSCSQQNTPVKTFAGIGREKASGASASATPNLPNRKEKSCFRCKSTTHLIADCPMRSGNTNSRSAPRTFTNTNARVNSCTTSRDNESETTAPSGDMKRNSCASAMRCACLDVRRDSPAVSDDCKSTIDMSSAMRSVVSINSKIVENTESHVEHTDFAKLKYLDIVIPEMPGRVISSLSDSGAEICVIKSALLNGVDASPVGTVRIRGLIGQPVEAELVNLTVQLADNKDCCATVLFAKCNEVNEDCILTADVANKLTDLFNRKVMLTDVITVDNDSSNTDTTIIEDVQCNAVDADTDHNVNNDHGSFIDVDSIDTNVQTTDCKASADMIKQEQQIDDTLTGCWALAKRGKGGYYVKEGLLYRCENVAGYETQLLLIPKGRRG